jgi:hypothetical protein
VRPWIYLLVPDIQKMDKIMETVVKETLFFTNTEFSHHLPVIQLVSFFEYILNSGNLLLTYSLKMTTVVR